MKTLARKAYPSDLTDAQWAILEPLVPPSKHGGRPRTVNMREVINTIVYLHRTGCQWDKLPHGGVSRPAPSAANDQSQCTRCRVVR